MLAADQAFRQHYPTFAEHPGCLGQDQTRRAPQAQLPIVGVCPLHLAALHRQRMRERAKAQLSTAVVGSSSRSNVENLSPFKR